VVKINFFLLCQAQISALATRARGTLTFDWLAFAVKLVLVGSWTIAQGTRAIFQILLSTKSRQLWETKQGADERGGHRETPAGESAAKQLQALQLCFSRKTLNLVENLGLTVTKRKDQAQLIAALKWHVEGLYGIVSVYHVNTQYHIEWYRPPRTF